MDAAAAHRHERRVHAGDLEAIQQARLRPQSAVLGCEEREARVDHVLPHGRRDDDDEFVQGGRDRRAVQPHSAGGMDRSSAADERSHGQAGVCDRLLHAEHVEGADGRHARAEGVQHVDRQSGPGRVPAHHQAAHRVLAGRHFPRLPAAGRRSVRSGAREAVARRGGLWRRQRQFRSGKVSDCRRRAHLQHQRA